MRTHGQPHAVQWPDFDAEWVRRWVQKTQDLVLLLDLDDRVSEALHDGVFEPGDVHQWIGQGLLDIVSPDTRPKVPLLLANDAARDGADDRWRHINLIGACGSVIPVLARFMRWSDPSRCTRTLICRDLRASRDLNQRHMMAHREIEQTVLDLRDALRQKDLEMTRMRLASVDVQSLVDQIRQGGFDQVIQQASQLLRRQCLQALLDLAHGDPVLAARLAGMDPKSWAERLRAVGL